MANVASVPNEPGGEQARTLGPIRVDENGEPFAAPGTVASSRTSSLPVQSVPAPSAPVTAAEPVISQPVAPGSALPATDTAPPLLESAVPVPPAGRERAVLPARHSVPAAGMVAVGILTVLVGAWAGIVPFVGALFGFGADGSAAWTWNLAHGLLWLAPGAVAVAMGLSMLVLVPRVGAGRARATSIAAGLVTVACGGWLVFGLSAWPVLNQPSVTLGARASALRLLTLQAGWTFGPGLVLVLLGGCAVGLALRRGAKSLAAPASAPTPAGTLGAWTPVN